MAMRERRINNLYASFIANMKNQTIEQYFSVPGKYKLIRDAQDLLCFEVEHEYIPQCNIDDLCEDVNKYIASFLYRKSTCRFRIIFTPSYPFQPTEWSIISLKSNENADFYKALAFQNHQYKMSWTPAISIEADILNMILQLVCLFDS